MGQLRGSSTRARLIWILLATLGLSGCVGALRSEPPPAKWTAGFWYWHGYREEAAYAKVTPDVIYVQAGKIWKSDDLRLYVRGSAASQWGVSEELPTSLPQAREYWLVFRAEQPGVPDLSAATMLTQRIADILTTTRQWKLKVAGVQLDIDSPTGSLSRYAEFLREVRKRMPPGLQLSVTALLDWFRDGTSVADVIEETDEFVPQFYDVASTGGSEGWRAIAMKIDAAQWAPRFNRFGKRYRIGISTFGRARYVPKEDPSHSGYAGLRLYSDFRPVDIAGNSAFHLQASRSEANELVLSYRPAGKVRIGYNDFQPGDLVQFILPTPEAVRAAVQSARRMGGNCGGVLFFRWPLADENLVMDPDDAWSAAGFAPPERKSAGVEAVNGHCAAVSCVDLYLLDTNAYAANPIHYRIRSSVELEYFLPADHTPVRMAGPADLEVALPAYGGRNRMLLGRVVSAHPATFRIEEEL
jgi:hypothetical protein